MQGWQWRGTRQPPRARPAPQVPAASLALFNTLSIILLIPVYDRGLVPLLRYFGTKLTLLSRIGARLAPLHGARHSWLSGPACSCQWTGCRQVVRRALQVMMGAPYVSKNAIVCIEQMACREHPVVVGFTAHLLWAGSPLKRRPAGRLGPAGVRACDGGQRGAGGLAPAAAGGRPCAAGRPGRGRPQRVLAGPAVPAHRAQRGAPPPSVRLRVRVRVRGVLKRSRSTCSSPSARREPVVCAARACSRRAGHSGSPLLLA